MRILVTSLPASGIRIANAIGIVDQTNNPYDMKQDPIQQYEHHDLCVTCRHQASCIYARNRVGPVHHCEEFEAPEFRPVKETGKSVEKKTGKQEIIYYGLCKNCGNRFTCMNASPDRIIWHCEEYV